MLFLMHCKILLIHQLRLIDCVLVKTNPRWQVSGQFCNSVIRIKISKDVCRAC